MMKLSPSTFYKYVAPNIHRPYRVMPMPATSISDGSYRVSPAVVSRLPGGDGYKMPGIPGEVRVNHKVLESTKGVVYRWMASSPSLLKHFVKKLDLYQVADQMDHYQRGHNERGAAAILRGSCKIAGMETVLPAGICLWTLAESPLSEVFEASQATQIAERVLDEWLIERGGGILMVVRHFDKYEEEPGNFERNSPHKIIAEVLKLSITKPFPKRNPSVRRIPAVYPDDSNVISTLLEDQDLDEVFNSTELLFSRATPKVGGLEHVATYEIGPEEKPLARVRVVNSSMRAGRMFLSAPWVAEPSLECAEAFHHLVSDLLARSGKKNALVLIDSKDSFTEVAEDLIDPPSATHSLGRKLGLKPKLSDAGIFVSAVPINLNKELEQALLSKPWVIPGEFIHPNLLNQGTLPSLLKTTGTGRFII